MTNIYPDDLNAETNYRWNYCYLHGQAERVFEQEVPDLFEADDSMPSQEGNYVVSIDGHHAIAVIRMHLGTLGGRIALVDDTEALKHALSPEDWR